MSDQPAPTPQPSSRSALAGRSCEGCGERFDLAGLDDRAALCAACFDSYLHDLETPFLENYARFGAKAHRTVAETLFRALVLADPDDRRVMGIRIVEEYLNAAEGLMALFTALHERRRAPVLRTFLEYRLDAHAAREFRTRIDSRFPHNLMRELGLPTLHDVEAARADIPARQYRQFRAALDSVAAGLTRAARVDQGALLRIADGLRGPSTLAHKVDWIPERRMNPDQVALLVLESKQRLLLTHALSIHESQLQLFVDAIDKITGATRDLIWLSLHMREEGASS